MQTHTEKKKTRTRVILDFRLPEELPSSKSLNSQSNASFMRRVAKRLLLLVISVQGPESLVLNIGYTYRRNNNAFLG